MLIQQKKHSNIIEFSLSAILSLLVFIITIIYSIIGIILVFWEKSTEEIIYGRFGIIDKNNYLTINHYFIIAMIIYILMLLLITIMTYKERTSLTKIKLISIIVFFLVTISIITSSIYGEINDYYIIINILQYYFDEIIFNNIIKFGMNHILFLLNHSILIITICKFIKGKTAHNETVVFIQVAPNI